MHRDNSDNHNPESKQSIFIKKFLTLTKMKETTLKNIVDKRVFIDKKNETPIPSHKLFKKYNITQTLINKRNVFTISPLNSESDILVLFIHGGAYMANFQPMYWSFIDKIIDKTNTTFICPDYPLAPDNTWKEAFHMLNKIYDEKDLVNKKYILMGDSAGAGLSLSWLISRKGSNFKKPEQLIFLSPWFDITLNNPEIDLLEHNDPYLSREALQKAGKYWAGEILTDSWEVSPLNGDLNGLPPVTIFTGTADILNNDAKVFKNKTEEYIDLKLNYREYKYMIHDWMFFKMPESDQCCNEIVALIKR
ncbi:MAG: alpha/beta hydrolase [Spirochaetales bacterium]|nr:alpha/beta hydrolase [Spirochaetales bacterium]